MDCGTIQGLISEIHHKTNLRLLLKMIEWATVVSAESAKS